MAYKPLFLLLFLLLSINCFPQENVFVRMNQVGFLPEESKIAVIFSKKPVSEKKYFILTKSGKILFSGIFHDTGLKIEGFDHSFSIDFSRLTEPGSFRIRIKGARDTHFSIGEKLYNPVVDSLMLFFRVQRCGPTDPLLHGPCHLSDVTSIPGYNTNNAIVDATGGWHDAGDYIKFLSTAAYTTYMLIFSYEFDPIKFGFDNDENSVPDILEEARVGLDWLLRCRLKDDLLITQVQDLRDHTVGWRLPENDTLRFDRPGYTGIGKNIIGIYSAALAIAARVWLNRFYDYEFAERCISAAEGVYASYEFVPDLDVVNSGVYQDDKYHGKLSLGASELYLTTRKGKYLEDAKHLADSAGSDFWWSWGDINALAHYRLSSLGYDYSEYILNNLIYFQTKMNSSLFGQGLDYTWGTTNSLLGVSLQAILYKELTGEETFDRLAVSQRDYVLGSNPWGVSFIHNIGEIYPRNLHSQVAYFRRGYLPGALSAGPAPADLLQNHSISRKLPGKYDSFNTGTGRYYDDYNDFITNEPTITGNATAVFVFGYFSSRGTVTD
jgi:endoglucanase